MENCKHLEPKTTTEEIVSFCAWCGNPLQRIYNHVNLENPDYNIDEYTTHRMSCDCWAFGKNYPDWLKKLYRIWLKINNNYNTKIFMEKQYASS